MLQMNFKRIIFHFLVMIAAFTSCDKSNENGNIKLLETMIYGDDAYYKYEYDNKNRITRMSFYRDENLIRSHKLKYSGNNLIRMEYENSDNPEGNAIVNFVRKKNSISFGDSEISYRLELNRDGTIATWEQIVGNSYSNVLIYHYKNGNIVKIMHSGEGVEVDDVEDLGVAAYIYDNKKSPFYYCQTPKWFLMFISENEFGNRNNTKHFNWFWGDTIEFQYEYDSDGFPITCTKSRTSKGEGKTVTQIEYIYK